MTRKSFLLRIDPALWDELERWAAAELRSVNGQVEFLLREAVVRRRGSPRQEGGAENPRAIPERGSEESGL